MAKHWTTIRRSDGRVEFTNDEGTACTAHWCRNQVHGCSGTCLLPDFPGRCPLAGDIALCGAGKPGLILSGVLQRVQCPDGNEAMAYVGVNLLTRERWFSRSPCLIGDLWDITLGGYTLRKLLREREVVGWPCEL